MSYHGDVTPVSSMRYYVHMDITCRTYTDGLPTAERETASLIVSEETLSAALASMSMHLQVLRQARDET